MTVLSRGSISLASLGVAIVASLLASCGSGSSDPLAASRPTCAVAASLVEPLIESRGHPESDGSLAPFLQDLAWTLEVVDDDPVATAAVDQLLQVARENSDGLSVDEFDTWYGPLDELDARIDQRCGFSIQLLVAASRAPGDLPPAILGPAKATEGAVLDWAEVQRRLPAAQWTDDYDGVVGTGPGLFVTVRGLPSEVKAAIVCSDVLAALSAEAATGEVLVEVEGTDRDLLASSLGGDCFNERSSVDSP